MLRGNGDGTFQAKQDFPVGAAPTSAISADFNGDSHADLAVANYSSSSVSVLLGQDSDGDGKGDGAFRSAGNFSVDLPCGGICIPATAGPNQVITADFNGDTKADLATANAGSCGFFCTPGGVSVLLGFGNGTFQDARLAMSNTTIYSIDASDSGDIAAAKYDSNVVSILRSNGNGTFSPGPQLPVGTNPSAVTSEDLDANGVEDLAVSNSHGRHRLSTKRGHRRCPHDQRGSRLLGSDGSGHARFQYLHAEEAELFHHGCGHGDLRFQYQ